MLSVFYFLVFRVWLGVFCPFLCRSSLLRVAIWKSFQERTFVFVYQCWSYVFWWYCAYVFALSFGGSLPKLFGKILLMSGLVFLDFFSLL